MTARAGFETYRTTRRELEEGLLRAASSLDGRTFALQASLHGLDLEIGASVGIAVAERGTTMDDLLRRADAAMYAAKWAGGRCNRDESNAT